LSGRVNATGIDAISSKLIVIDTKEGYIKAQVKFYRELKKFEPDIVHAWDHISAVIAIIPKVFLHFKMIDGSIRGASRLWKRRFFMAISYLFTDMIVANSIAGLKSAGRSLNKKHRVIYNGFDQDRIREDGYPAVIKQKLNIGNDLVVGMVANIRPAKDYNGFVKLAVEIIKQRENVVFLSLGSGTIDPVLMESVEPSLRNKIIFLGRIDNPEDYIKIFDVGILLNDTRFGMEGLSNAILEYMAIGKPVVATNAGGNPEIVAEGISGYLIPPFDMKTAAEKIIYLLDNETVRNQLGRNGMDIARQKFSLEKMTSSYLHLYSMLKP
jgi:glycosyltransferase involved in cell wall biosynthesis